MSETAGKAGEDAKTISEHIRVFCRQKPELPEETTAEDDADGGMYLTADNGTGSTEPCVQWNVEESSCEYKSSVSSKANTTFKLDGVFTTTVGQQEVFETAARPIVDSVLQGYSGTIFAYGPTGAGKTWSVCLHSFSLGAEWANVYLCPQDYAR